MANRPIIRSAKLAGDSLGDIILTSSTAKPPINLPPSAALLSPRGKAHIKDTSPGGSPQVGKAKSTGRDDGDGEAYISDEEELPAHDLSQIIEDMERKLAENIGSFERKMKDKETEMVKECKFMYKADKKKAKDDIAALRKKLNAANGDNANAAQVLKEEKKMQLWLEHKLMKIEAVASKRLAATEKAFDEFRHQEYDRLCRINNKLKAKMAILKERQYRTKKERTKDNDNALLPNPGDNDSKTGKKDSKGMKDAKSKDKGKDKDKKPTSKDKEEGMLREKENAHNGEDDQDEGKAKSKGRNEDDNKKSKIRDHVDREYDSEEEQSKAGKFTPKEKEHAHHHHGHHGNHPQKDNSEHRDHDGGGVVLLPDEEDISDSEREAQAQWLAARGKGPNKKLPGQSMNGEHPILDMKARNPIVLTNAESSESMFQKKGGPNAHDPNPYHHGSPGKRVTIMDDLRKGRAGADAAHGREDRPKSPPIPTHMEGGSRFVGEFKGGKKRQGQEAQVFKVGTDTEDVNPKGTYGATRWDDDIEQDDDEYMRSIRHGKPKILYSGSGSMGTEVPMLKDFKKPEEMEFGVVVGSHQHMQEKNKTRMAYGRNPPAQDQVHPEHTRTHKPGAASHFQHANAKISTKAFGDESNPNPTYDTPHNNNNNDGDDDDRVVGRMDINGNANKNAKPSNSSGAGNAKHEGRTTVRHADANDEYRHEPNPNAKPLTGKGMTVKPLVVHEKPRADQKKKGGKVSKSKVVWNHGREIANFKAGKPRFQLSYDSKMNLRHNREEYLNDMARVLQRFHLSVKSKVFANIVMAPFRALRKEQHGAATKFQLAWRAHYARKVLMNKLMVTLRSLQMRALFSFICFLCLFIARWRRRRTQHERFVTTLLAKVLKKREALILQRKVEALNVHSHYHVQARTIQNDFHVVPRGLTKELQKRAQIRAEQRMLLGPLAGVADSLDRAKKTAGMWFGKLFQINLAEVDIRAVDTIHDHISRVQSKALDLSAGYKSSYSGATSINDVRAAHIREGAIGAFVQMKNSHKQSVIKKHHISVNDASDSEGSNSD